MAALCFGPIAGVRQSGDARSRQFSGQIHLDGVDLQLASGQKLGGERVADGAEAVVEVVLELVAAFQADAARADHRQIQRGALGERVGLGQGLEGEHEGILHRLRGLADGDPHTQNPRRAGLAGASTAASMTPVISPSSCTYSSSSFASSSFWRLIRRPSTTRAMSKLPS